jgi:hypothetical protein
MAVHSPGLAEDLATDSMPLARMVENQKKASLFSFLIGVLLIHNYYLDT